MPLRIVFFGNSQSTFSNRFCQAFAQAPCQIAGVVDVPPVQRTSTYSHAPAGVLDFVEWARRAGVPSWEPESPNLPEVVAALRWLQPDMFVAAGYMSRFKAESLSVPRLLTVNFHASLLPAYRGKHPVFWALRNGERWSGLTIHVVDAGLDTGDILYQVRVRTRRQDTVASLYDRIMECSMELVPRLVQDAQQGRLHGRRQPEQGASYYSAVHEQDFRLDWQMPAERLRRMIQATPGQCFSELGGRRWFLLDAGVVAHPEPAAPGTLLEIGRTSVCVKAGQGALRLRRVRWAGAAEQPAPQLCRELNLQPGSVFSGARGPTAG
jgi:methionyl-tRNA formyltransferase